MPDLLKNQPALTDSRLRFREFLKLTFVVRRYTPTTHSKLYSIKSTIYEHVFIE